LLRWRQAGDVGQKRACGGRAVFHRRQPTRERLLIPVREHLVDESAHYVGIAHGIHPAATNFFSDSRLNAIEDVTPHGAKLVARSYRRNRNCG